VPISILPSVAIAGGESFTAAPSRTRAGGNTVSPFIIGFTLKMSTIAIWADENHFFRFPLLPIAGA
jgi:hypothetical protein